MNKLKVLDLFSGIGGFSLGLERTGGFETVAFCEIEPFCQKVLKKHWPDVPIYEDVRTLEYDGPVDLICGGYPCQPFSVAGKREGAEDDRHLWPAMFSLIKKHRPTWVIGENVAGHISMGLDEVLADLESENYGARAFVIPACAVDAPHRRDRVWIVSHRDNLLHPRGLDTGRDCETSSGSERSDQFKAGWSEDGQRVWSEPGTSGEDVANTNGFGMEGPRSQQQAAWSLQRSETLPNSNSLRPQGQGRSKQSSNSTPQRDWQEHRAQHDGRWEPEPNVGRVSNGVSNRTHRLKSLGNAVVPQVVQRIGEAILHAEQV